MKDRIVELANEALTSELGLGDSSSWGIGPGEQKSDAELLDAIDRGKYLGGRIGRKLSVFVDIQKAHYYLRYVDYRSYRWNQRFSSRRTVRCLPFPHRGLHSASGRYRMPKSSYQPPKF